MSEMGGVEVEHIDLTQIVGEIETPCDWMKFECCSKGKAEWIAVLVPCTCGASGGRLICTQCRDYVLTTDMAAECGKCGNVVAPFRHVIVAFEPLVKP